MHPQGIETLTAEEKLRHELLRTYEEYYQLLLEIINSLSPDTARLRSDLPVTDFLIDKPTINVAQSNGSRKSIIIDGKIQMH